MTRFACITCFVATLSGAPLRAQEPAPLASIPASTTFEIHSEAVGADFQVSVSYPLGYGASDTQYPVLYVLDAWWTFGMATDIARVLFADEIVPPMLVVGVGYPGGIADAVVLRFRDMTLRQSAELEQFVAGIAAELGPHPPITTGGADAFLRFLTEELMPRVERDYGADPTRRILHGHSLGGAFVMDVLFREPTAFTDYISSAPGLVLDDGLTFHNEQAYSEAHDALPARLFLAVGRDDTALPGLAESVTAMADTLRTRRYRGLEWEVVYYEDETHRSVMPVVLRDALRHFSRTPD
jgi:predicted alpha/beta superfamily hydrolase